MKNRSTYLFSSLLAAMLCGGCADNEVETPSSSNRISLGVTTSRTASATVSAMEADPTGFKVYATAGSATNVWYAGISGTNNHVHVNDMWGFANPVAWPAPGSSYPMKFYAWYPAAPAGLTVTNQIAPMLQARFAVQSAATAAATTLVQKDLIYGTATATAKPDFDMLVLKFRHALSKIDFGIIPGEGAIPVIQSLVVANVGDTRTFDFMTEGWLATPTSFAAKYPYYGTLDFLDQPDVGNTATIAPFTVPALGASDNSVPFYTGDHTGHLMLMPQTGITWIPSATQPSAGRAVIYLLYRMVVPAQAAYDPQYPDQNLCDEVGYRTAERHPGWNDYSGDWSSYAGPLYVCAAFPLPAGSFTWEQGKGYTYNIGLGTPGSCNGYLADGFYFDDRGRRTDLPVRDGRKVGDKLKDGVIHVTVDVDIWDSHEHDPTP